MITTLSEIARLVEGELLGGADVEISGVSGLDEAVVEPSLHPSSTRRGSIEASPQPSLTEKNNGQIVVIANPRDIARGAIHASAIIIPEGAGELSLPLLPDGGGSMPAIRVKNPRLALARLIDLFHPFEKPAPFIHPSSIIAADVQLGRDVTIHPHVVIDSRAVIGDGVILYPFVHVGRDAHINDETIIHSHVTIYEKSVVGKGVIIHAGCVIGADGFGYVQVDEIHHKIPQAGNVVIGDGVEIGANTTIDRATLGSTIIGWGTKIDNLVQIGHNVKIGKNCILVAQVAIGGSAVIGDGVIIAGQGGVADHVTIGHHSIVGAKAGVMKDIPAKSMVSGFPARPYRDELRQKAYVERLPELFRKGKRL